ncbi:MAG: hypothetical protein WCK31_03420 [bacterium]
MLNFGFIKNSRIINIISSKVLSVFFLVIFIYFFSILLIHNQAFASESVMVSASVYSCDFQFQLGVEGANSSSDLTTNVEIQFQSLKSDPFILKLPTDQNGKASGNLCDYGVYLQTGIYDLNIKAFNSAYKSISKIELFSRYQTNLNVNLTSSDFEYTQICLTSAVPILTSSTNNQTARSTIGDSASNSPISLGLLIFLNSIFKQKIKGLIRIKTLEILELINPIKRINKLISNYLNSIKYSILLIKSIIYCNG